MGIRKRFPIVEAVIVLQFKDRSTALLLIGIAMARIFSSSVNNFHLLMSPGNRLHLLHPQ